MEFKESFNKGNTAKYAKTMAAYANNRGGYIIFGVKDNPRSVIGLSNNNFDNLNQEQFTEAINSLFSPAMETKENLKQFNPMFTLRYSATHKSDSIYNMIYRLDAMEAYNKRLVKKIAVKGITESGSTATESYVYLEGINP